MTDFAKDTNVPTNDCISRQAAIDACMREDVINGYDVACLIAQLPTADLSEYCDKLWKTAYERGKAEAHPKKGKWVLRPGDYICIYTCSECGAVGHRTAFCPNCGARMEESDD